MKNKAKTWLQLYVDAMTERDPYKRLALVQELRSTPRQDESEEPGEEPVMGSVSRLPAKRSSLQRNRPFKKSKIVRQH